MLEIDERERERNTKHPAEDKDQWCGQAYLIRMQGSKFEHLFFRIVREARKRKEARHGDTIHEEEEVICSAARSRQRQEEEEMNRSRRERESISVTETLHPFNSLLLLLLTSALESGHRKS